MPTTHLQKLVPFTEDPAVNYNHHITVQNSAVSGCGAFLAGIKVKRGQILGSYQGKHFLKRGDSTQDRYALDVYEKINNSPVYSYSISASSRRCNYKRQRPTKLFTTATKKLLQLTSAVQEPNWTKYINSIRGPNQAYCPTARQNVQLYVDPVTLQVLIVAVRTLDATYTSIELLCDYGCNYFKKIC